ncbi:GDP-mannose 4,6-dehydratase [Povalibacter sp.]|uniref:GDP-mannose 4,6-dehydratase n=1 Tax=Povalibacter sp. TaxID=1962978 RepID=UPI0039C93638
MARLLHNMGYEVFGSSRDAFAARRDGLAAVGVTAHVQLLSMAPNDFRSVLQTVNRVEPDEIYNLAGQSSVGLSFDQPVETIESISLGTLNLLEAIRFVERPIRFYNAGSSECFGDTGATPASEITPFRPRSPYAVAKACAHNLVANYRDAYAMHASTGILFNHESPLRPERFVTQKIVRAAARIAAGSDEVLKLGNLDIHRDWGWAPEYVEAMWLMLQQDQPRDFVIATGRTIALKDFVATAFSHYGLNWQTHVQHDPSLVRPTDIRSGAADPGAALRHLGWQAYVSAEEVVARMCDAVSDIVSAGGASEHQSQ